MQICLIGDTHYGCRNDNQYFYDYMQKFFDNIFFPYLKKYKINRVIHLGDLTENRRQINLQTANRLRNDFLEPVKNNNIDFSIIAGNHDVFYKNTNKINSLRELIGDNYPNITIIDNLPVESSEGLLVPWINSENKEESLNIIRNSKAKYCFGHFELKGFDIGKGRLSSAGLDINSGIFNNFHQVFSGHYHNKSNLGHINYIGSSFAFNWGDWGDYRGFAILDLETENIKYIRNPYKIFSKIEYDEDKKNMLDDEDIKNTYCRVKVINKISESKFKNFIDNIHEIGVIDLLIDDNPPRIEVNEKIGQTDSTIDFFKRSINDLDFNDKNGLELLTEKVYKEALEI